MNLRTQYHKTVSWNCKRSVTLQSFGLASALGHWPKIKGFDRKLRFRGVEMSRIVETNGHNDRSILPVVRSRVLFTERNSACTNGRFGRFYAEKWLPYAENLKLGRTLTSSKNRVRPSAIAVTYTSVLRICAFDLAAVSRKSRVRNGCDFGKNRLTNRRSRQPRSARPLSVIVNLIDR